MNAQVSSRGYVSWFRPTGGYVLLEVMLAVAVLGIAMTGFVVALDQIITASTAAHRDAELRLALQSRLAEMKAESVTLGAQSYEYAGGRVLVEESVESTNLRDGQDQTLSGLYRVGPKARFKEGNWPPLTGELVVYQP